MKDNEGREAPRFAASQVTAARMSFFVMPTRLAVGLEAKKSSPEHIRFAPV